MSDIDPKWVVLRRTNGHYEPAAGPTIKSFTDPVEADKERELLVTKYPGQRFALFTLVDEVFLEPTVVKESV